MAVDNFIGEIRMYGGDVAPSGWAFCNGQILPISGNEALYGLIGTTYGGDGQNTFALPDLRGRMPISAGPDYGLGQMGGEEQVTLQVANLPTHGHSVGCSNVGTLDSPKGNIWGQATDAVYGPVNAFLTAMSTLGVSIAGKGKPHDNMSPFLCVSFMIALQGIYPSKG